jgi:hypothetical protein
MDYVLEETMGLAALRFAETPPDGGVFEPRVRSPGQLSIFGPLKKPALRGWLF